MTPVDELSPAELRERGLQALLRELGPVNYARFMQQFLHAGGDYTRDRQKWLGDLTLDDISKLIEQNRSKDT